MSRNTALAVVHPSSTSRIERKADELDAVRAKIKALTAEKDALSEQLLKLVRREGEEDEKGKVRYATDAHKFVVIEATNRTTSGAKAIQMLIKLGVNAKLAAKAIARATSETDYEYVRVDKASDPDSSESDGPRFSRRDGRERA